jgi:hypothetical protein
MATEATVVEIDRERIKELTDREERKLDDRTTGSRAMFERARKTLAGGVASSYQLRDPWPLYLSHGKGPRVWDVDGNELLDFHNGFGSMVQGHAHPAIEKAVAERYPLGTHFAVPTEDAVVVGEELARRWGLPRWRYTNSGSEATMDAIRIARAVSGRDTILKIFGSYHGHHDYVMVSIGVPYDQIGDRDDYASLPYGAGIPQAAADLTVPVPFSDANAMERRIERLTEEGRPPGCVIMEPAMMNLGVVPPRARLPRGCARDHAPPRHRPHLRRGQDGPLHRGGRRDRALRRHAGHGHARQDAGRRPSLGRDRRHRGGLRGRRERKGLPGGHVQREPAVDGRCARASSRFSPPTRTSTSTRSTSASSAGARA